MTDKSETVELSALTRHSGPQDSDRSSGASLAKKIQAQKEKLIGSLERMIAESDCLERLGARVHENAEKAKTRILLDVGGKRYRIPHQILSKFPDSYFTALLSGAWSPEEVVLNTFSVVCH